MTAKWTVHKFGGTSLADADRFRQVGQILKTQKNDSHPLAVVSAMASVTDKLIAVAALAGQRKSEYETQLFEIRDDHFETAGQLLTDVRAQKFNLSLTQDIDDIKNLLKAAWVLHSTSENTVDAVSGYGEVWSARLLASHLSELGYESNWVDARDLITIESTASGPAVLWSISQRRWDDHAPLKNLEVAVLTGFIARFEDGAPTTLKRNGSDWSAAIAAKLIAASAITIWKEVDGFMSADPRIVPDAVPLGELSYREAAELAFFGAKVLHPKTMAPAMEAGIPIHVRNTFRPQDRGTVVRPRADRANESNSDAAYAVKGFALVDAVGLINLEGTGMIGVPGISERLFRALRQVNVSVILISQASSEQSICFAVPKAQTEIARSAVETEFKNELQGGLIQKVDVLSDCSILAAVGDNMVHTPGVAARFFRSLSIAGVNIHAIAQGSSERNISVVIAHRDRHRALRAAHSGFYLSDQTLSIGLIGPGLIGSELLSQIEARHDSLKTQYQIDLRIRAIADSKKMWLSETAIDIKNWKDGFQKHALPLDFEQFAAHVKPAHIPHAVIVDSTASANVASHYGAWAEKGLHIVTPNKKANSGAYSSYREMSLRRQRHRSHYLYSTTVGAGLPIISTLRDLVQTGDTILKIEGIFSGTLSFLFNTLAPNGNFSDIVKEAKVAGYTEPDPRDDLSGADVTRKLVILAREMGLDLEYSDVTTESLVPESLRDLSSVDEFMKRLPEFDASFRTRLETADRAGHVLRYVGVIEPSESTSRDPTRVFVSLKEYPKSHPFGRISGSDNIVSFTTERYKKQSLFVQGPGAGPQVTAAGVFADLLRLSSYLGAVR